MNEIICLKDVTKTFKDKKAVDGVSFSIRQGEVAAILGPNGAGKTTTLSMMLGLLQPSSGTVKVLGENPNSRKVREKIGAMLQEVSVIDALTVKEVIQLFRSYYPEPLSFEELVNLSGLKEDELKKRAEKLSGGQKRRLSFALAMAGDPEVLFFDEPTVGMDIHSRKIFWQTVHLLKNRGKTIIFTTHYLQEADDTAERIILFHNGRLIEDGSPAEIKAKLTRKSVSFRKTEAINIKGLENLPHIQKVSVKGGRVHLETDDTDAVLSSLYKLNGFWKDIQVDSGRLEDAFEQLTEEKEAV